MTGADYDYGWVTPGSGGSSALVNAPFNNVGIAASVGGSALTIALKTAAGADPGSAPSDSLFNFRNVSLSTGTPTLLSVTSATSLVVTSGSTLGAVSGGVPFAIWVIGFNDGGTFRPGVIKCADSDNSIFSLRGPRIASSMAEGGGGGADSAQVFYTGTAVSSKAYVIIARLVWESGLTTAGTWASAPTRIELADSQLALPGDIVQTRTKKFNTSSNTGSDTLTATVVTNTITPTSAANLIEYAAEVPFELTNGTGSFAMFRDSTNLNGTGAHQVVESIEVTPRSNAPMYGVDAPGSSSSVTYTVHARANNGTGSLTVNIQSLGDTLEMARLMLRELQT